MRTSILSRSVIALATLAITSAALTAAPATAAAPSGVTRSDVLAAASAIRSDPGGPFEYSAATQRTLRKLALNKCTVDAQSGESVIQILAVPIESSRNIDGLVTSAIIYTPEAGGDDEVALRGCSFGALAATPAGSVLSGSATLNGSTTITSRLSGDVFTTPTMIDATAEEGEEDAPLPSFSAKGESVHSTTSTLSTKVWTHKTAEQKRAAKKTYITKFKAAKKAYAKALKKARHDKSKRSKAKKVYTKKVTSAKKTYRKAITRTFTIVRNTRSTVTTTTFSVAASYDLTPPPEPQP